MSRELIQKLRRAYVNLLETGRDRIISAGGQCDPVDVMEARDPVLREVALYLAAPAKPHYVLNPATGMLHEAPTAPVAPVRHVGESKFEDWLSCHAISDVRGAKLPVYHKQDMRDAYAAGMSDPGAAPVAPAEPFRHIRFFKDHDDLRGVVYPAIVSDSERAHVVGMGDQLIPVWAAPVAPALELLESQVDAAIKAWFNTATDNHTVDGFKVRMLAALTAAHGSKP